MFVTNERILNFLKIDNLTINFFCNDVSIHRSTLNKWSKSFPKLNYLSDISNYFNVTSDYLLGLNDIPNLKFLYFNFPIQMEKLINLTEEHCEFIFRLIDKYNLCTIKLRGENIYDASTLYVKIMNEMTDKRISKAELCREAHIQLNTLNSWDNSNDESKHVDPQSKHVIAVAQFLGVSVDYLMGKANEAHPYLIRKTISLKCQGLLYYLCSRNFSAHQLSDLREFIDVL